MSVVRPHRSARDSEPDNRSSGDREPARRSPEGPSEAREPAQRLAPERPSEAREPAQRLGPSAPPPPLNSRPPPASNHKQARAREAEEDRALIARAQAGDTGAFRRLVERHQRRAFAIALALVRDENDARELVQDAFLRVFKSLPSFQGGSSFFTWLYRIITNLSIDLIRKPGRQTADIEDARLELEDAQEVDSPFLSRFEGADPADLVRRREIGAKLQQALDALPSYHRAVIVMREIDGLSYEEMAQVVGVSKGTIMSRLFHARQKLQRALTECYREQIGVSPSEQEQAESPPSSGGA
jgi:RNA polymerase sigma-70 factor (ECF subfamily)